MISSRHIEVFFHIYNEGSLTRAAKILNVSQPLISKTLAYTEDKLNCKLFVRHSRKLSPTPEADILFKHAAKVSKEVSKFNNIAENLVSHSDATINIGCTPSLGLGLLPGLLSQYLKFHPGTKFNIVNLQSADLENQLKELTFDLVICFNPITNKLFTKSVLHSGSLVVIAPLKIAPINKVVNIAEFRDEPFIKIKNLQTNASQNNLDEHLMEGNLSINWVAETETIQVAKAMVEEGVGMAIIDDFSANVYGDTLSVHQLEPNIPYEIAMLSNNEKPLSVRAKDFIQFLARQAIDTKSS